MVLVGLLTDGRGFEAARVRWGSSDCASLRGSDMFLGGSFRCVRQVWSRRARRERCRHRRAELVFKGVCARARNFYRLWTEISTAQVNERIR